MNNIKHLYIHIPFCNKICSYCAFTKFFYNEEYVLKYLDALECEINEKYKGNKLDTIYIGGGTPSSLSKDALNKLKSIISKLNINKNYEFTFEINPDIDLDKLKIIKSMGVNRISIGVETINSKFYKEIGRENDKKKLIKLINYSKKLFGNVNIDLMYGFRNESIKDLDKDIDFVLAQDVEHISIYGLMIEEHTKLFVEGYKEVSDDKLNKMYYHMDKRLEDAGYEHYEISNFAKNGFISRHNNSYWENKEYYGFGIGASGYINNIRYDNTKSFSNYLNKKYIFEYENLSIYDKMIYEMILGLRTKKGVGINDFRKKYHKDIMEAFKIEDLIDSGYLKIEKGYIFIPKKYFFVENSILERFV